MDMAKLELPWMSCPSFLGVVPPGSTDEQNVDMPDLPLKSS